MSFKLRLLSQNWIDDDPQNVSDLCSHGSIYLKIGDNVVADEEDGEWTVDTKDLVCYLKDKEPVTVSKTTYVRDILRFADSVAQFLENSPERVIEESEYDRNEYSAFLDEFNSLRDKARDVLKRNA